MNNRRHLRVCIDARIPSTGAYGGVEQVVIGLASGLSKLANDREEYIFLTYEGLTHWLEPYISGPCRIYAVPRPLRIRVRQCLGKAAPLAERLRAMWQEHLISDRVKIPNSDGTIERLGADIMHFTFQSAFLTDVPSIFHPHDLQHLHLPDYFTRRERVIRETQYRAFCEQARIVAVASTWTKRDVIHHYRLQEEKVNVIPLAPPNDCYPTPSEVDLAAARESLGLPVQFIFYPAQTWPHKNHIGLLKALANLRDRRGFTVPLVCSGRQRAFFRQIKSCIRELDLNDQVRFLGYVSPLQLQCLYRLSRATVIPTRFEAGSFPLWEAALAGSPVACSNVTSLPQQAGDAALLFDPTNEDDMAEAIARLWQDQALRTKLARRARQNVKGLSWERTARNFQILYRRIVQEPLGDAHRAVLEAPYL